MNPTTSYCHSRKPRPRDASATTLLLLASFSALTTPVTAGNHLDQPPVQLANRANSDVPLIVTSNCAETIYPAILRQSGAGPDKSGFRLKPGESLPQTVSADWRGRVWGRTNCTFANDGTLPPSGQGGAACSSGDCGSFVECQGAVSCDGKVDANIGSDFDRAILRRHLQNSHWLPLQVRPSTTSLL